MGPTGEPRAEGTLETRGAGAALCAVLFCSGAAALIFERLWFHQAALALGSSVWASSIVLGAFMAGLALGNGLAARAGRRIARPLRAYAGLEVAIAASGVALVVLLPRLTPYLAPMLRGVVDRPAILNGTRLAVSFALLVIPAAAMGATLPLVVSSLFRREGRFGRVLGRLYGWNTLGAVAGVLAAEIALIEWLGIRGTAAAAAGLNAVAALAAIGLSRAIDRPGEPRVGPAGAPAASREGGRSPLLLGVAGLLGAILLALEVIWFRFLLLFVDGTGLAFALMLAAVLAGIGIGGLAASAWMTRDPSADRHLAALCLAAGAVACGVYAGFDLVVRAGSSAPAATWAETASLALPLVLPGSILSGLMFALVGQALQRGLGSGSRSTGLLTLANTLGAMGGAFAAGFGLLPRLGVERSIRILAAAYAVAAVVSVVGSGGRRSPRDHVVLAAWGAVFVLSLALFPAGLMQSRYLRYPVAPFARDEGAVPVAIREGLNETIQYLRVDRDGKPFYYRMLTNHFSMSATHLRSQRYMRLFAYWPAALHARPRSALLLCYGVGVTAKALTEDARLETLDVVDISRDVLELGRIVYPEPGEHPLDDPRVRVHVEDGRQFLELTERRYDVITGEPPPPGIAGVTSLYTAEFFRLARSRLADGGMLTYWLPVAALHEEETRSIVAAFCAAFEDCSLWSGSAFNWMLVGTRGARGPVPLDMFVRPWRDPVSGPALRSLAIERPEQLGALFIAGADDLREMARGALPLVDDHPKRLRDERADPATVAPIYARWQDVDLARERFARSEVVARLWPEALREPTLRAFDLQRIVQAVSHRDHVPAAESLPALHVVLTQTDLRTLPMLLLGAAVERAALVRPGADPASGPGAGFLPGIDALARRDYEAAASHFERALAAGDRTPATLYFRLYALSMSGRSSEAAALAERAGLPRSDSDGGAAAWRFLDRTFGLASVSAASGP